MNSVCKLLGLVVAAALGLHGQSVDEARRRYDRTDYAGALEALSRVPATPASLQLKGEVQFRLGDFASAAELFEQCVASQPRNAMAWLWLGRAQGRRAETGNPLRAPYFAGKTRDAFEKAVELDPANLEASVDLFSYYLNAPGFLGGGLDKAERLAGEHIRPRSEAEYASAMAQLAVARKQFDVAEKQLRRAVALAPREGEKLADLARFLARQGRHAESDQEFRKARELSPGQAGIVFAQAETMVASGRRLEEAQGLLEQYLRMSRTPDDPPPAAVQRLRKKITEAKGM